MRGAGAVAAVLLAVGASGCSSGAATKATSTTPSPSTTATVVNTTEATPPSTSTTTSTTTTTEAATANRTIADLLSLGRPIVLAHTGGEDQFPGSTLFAFGESMQAGVDMLDLNVQLSADGVLVVQHDDTVDGGTEGTGKVGEMTFDQLQALDDAYWFTTDCVCKDKPESAYLYRGIRTGHKPPPTGYAAADFAIPSLRQLIQRFPAAPLNIEIKGSGEPAKAAARQLLAELTELHRLDATVVASFDDEIVGYFHRLAPQVPMSPGLAASTAWVVQGTPLPDGMRILQLPPEFEGTPVLTPDVVARSRAAGYPIWVWPNDRRQENADAYATFLDEGLDGLNINYPQEGVAARDAWVAATGDPRPSAGCTADSAQPGETTQPFSAAGLDGTVIRHLPPAYDGQTPLPLVLDLHGYVEPASIQRETSMLATLGDARRFITFLPDITRPVARWDTSLDGGDLVWLRAMLADATSSMCIDLRRVYVAGLSNGAMMTSAVACTLSDTVAAVAAVAGIADPPGCSPVRAVPLLAFHGTDDGFLMYRGGFGPKVATLPAPDGRGTLGDVATQSTDPALGSAATRPVPEVVAAWAARNGCSPDAPATEQVAADVVEISWSCPSGGSTALYRIDGGGHAWPGSAFSASTEAIAGHTTMNIDASAIIWSFFRDHPLPA